MHGLGAKTPDLRAAFECDVNAVKRQLRTFKSIASGPGIGLGPLLGAGMDPSAFTVSYATRIGARAADVPWDLRNTPNPLIYQHACIAADFGMALEPAGHWVLSEREISTRIDRHGFDLHARFEARYEAPNGRAMNKKPDVAILAPNGTDYIAVEAERDTDRSISCTNRKCPPTPPTVQYGRSGTSAPARPLQNGSEKERAKRSKLPRRSRFAS